MFGSAGLQGLTHSVGRCGGSGRLRGLPKTAGPENAKEKNQVEQLCLDLDSYLCLLFTQMASGRDLK